MIIKKLLVIFTCLAAFAQPAHSKDYPITKFGATTDSTRLNTQAIQRTIDQAAAAGGGTVLVPKGVFLTGALFFKPKTSLRLQAGAVLKGSDNIADYPFIPSRMEGRSLNYYAALINAYQVNNFSVTGPGTINGNGLRFWKSFWAHRDSMNKQGKPWTNMEVHRPRLLFIWGCDNVAIKNVKLHNAGYWTTHLYQCTNVLVENCDIRSPNQGVLAPSTDGVDIDVCKHVIVRGCYISVNDDGVCIKGGKGPTAQKLPENGVVEDVLVENCTFGPGVHASLTCGSESIHARNITMRNCIVDNDNSILHLKMRPDTYQVYENITLDNITGRCGSIVLMNPWTQFYDLNGSTEKPYGIVRNISVSNIKVKCKNFSRLEGNPSDQVTGVTFKNIEVTAKNDGFLNKYADVELENVRVNGAALPQ